MAAGIKNGIWKKGVAVILLAYLILLGYWEWFCDRSGQFWGAGQVVLWPFAGVRAASRTFACSGWMEIFAETACFLPAGLFFPVVRKRFRRFRRILVFLILLSLTAELGKLIGGNGSFVMDQAFGHLFGGLTGYGFYKIGACLWAVRSRRHFLRELQERHSYKESQRQEENIRELNRKARLAPVLLAQLPFTLLVLFFSVVFGVYHTQVYGNLECDYAALVELANTRITVRSVFSSERGQAGVYLSQVYDESRGRARAEELLAGTGRRIASGDLVDRKSIRCRDEEGETELWLDLTGGTFTLTDYSRRLTESDEPVEGQTGADEETIRRALEEWNLRLPEGGLFRENGGGTYLFEYKNIVDGERLYSGTVLCEYHIGNQLSRVDYQIPECVFYEECPRISEQEAYENLIAGKFYVIGYESGRGITRLEINGMGLCYSLDSKGFYQPVYRVNAVINGREANIDLPALSWMTRWNGGSAS